MTTIFEKIINRELPAEILFENERIIAIKDKFPKAPVHLLVIAKKVIPSFQEIKPNDWPLVTEMLQIARKLAKEHKIEKGYRLVTNIGETAGQSILHLHFHILGGTVFHE